jgi:putative transposase
MRYIEFNPVRARMAEHPADYPWSSYLANAQGAPDGLIFPHSLYRRLGRTDDERQYAYRELIYEQIPVGDVEAIRDATNKAWALGDLRFISRIESQSKRRAVPLLRGRHKRKFESDPN